MFTPKERAKDGLLESDNFGAGQTTEYVQWVMFGVHDPDDRVANTFDVFHPGFHGDSIFEKEF